MNSTLVLSVSSFLTWENTLLDSVFHILALKGHDRSWNISILIVGFVVWRMFIPSGRDGIGAMLMWFFMDLLSGLVIWEREAHRPIRILNGVFYGSFVIEKRTGQYES